MRVRAALNLLAISLLLLNQLGNSQRDSEDAEIDETLVALPAATPSKPSPRVRLFGTILISFFLGSVAFGVVAMFKGPAAGLIAVTAAGVMLVAYAGFAQIYSYMHREEDPEIAQEWALSALAGFGMGGVMLVADPVMKLLMALFGLGVSSE